MMYAPQEKLYLTSYDMTPGFKAFTIKIDSDLRFIRP